MRCSWCAAVAASQPGRAPPPRPTSARRALPRPLPAAAKAAGGKKLKVVAYDYGIKLNILRRLTSFGCSVTVVPADYPADKVLAMDPDGVFFSNGPVSQGTQQQPLRLRGEEGAADGWAGLGLAWADALAWPGAGAASCGASRSGAGRGLGWAHNGVVS